MDHHGRDCCRGYMLGKAGAGRVNKADRKAVGRPTGSDNAATSSDASEGGVEDKSVEDNEWEWPVYDRCRKSGKYILQTKNNVKKPESASFAVRYDRRRDEDVLVNVELYSKALIKVAQECLPKYIEKLLAPEPLIDGRTLYIALNSFKRTMLKDDTSLDVQHHLKHLIRFLETEYADSKALEERTLREHRVSWHQLWVFFHKGERVYYTCALTGRTLLGVVQDARYCDLYEEYYKSGEPQRHFQVELRGRDYNGNKYVRSSVKIEIPDYMTEESFEFIGLGPMRLMEQSEMDKHMAKFRSNGKKFHSIICQRNWYMQYEGPRIRKEKIDGSMELTKQNADGRVMVDLLSFARLEPGYPLGSATPDTRICAHIEMPDDDDLMLAPAVVYGFSFANKQWGAFDIQGLSGIEFNDRAYDYDLVFSDPSRKKMLLDLVSEYSTNLINGNNDSVPKLDPISNKGDGCVILCYGPPGTGKTLTAQSIAEKLQCPLWEINVFELGRTPEDLERKLMHILDIASQWQAVLLLDEADIYMEERTLNGDPNRTAMTSIFLRLIEYYRGVLFLTTNRVASFDAAFCSRISIFLPYYRLEGDQRTAVWSSLLARAGIENPDLKPFMEADMNGREIRNTVRVAQAWAKSSKEKLTTDHVVQMVKMVGEFQQDLERAIQDESDKQTISQARARVRSMKCRPDSA